MPNDDWYTIETRNFRVHFAKSLEAEGRRAAVDAERAWAELSTELEPPRGKVDLVIADNVDYVNGYASTFPSNRIVVFAHPPVDVPELRNYGDWSRLVITHELTHIFHLDRADGIWRVGRSIFGRHPALFPNAYLPAWVLEGLAVYYESRITGAGRLEGSEHYMLSRAAAEAHRVPPPSEWSRTTTRYPGGEVVYAYGAQLLDYLSRTRGPDAISKFVDVSSKVLLPLSLNRKAKRAFGISFSNAWRDWRDSLVRTAAPGSPVAGWHELTHDGRTVAFPRWLGDTAVLYTAANGREVPGAYSVDLEGNVRRIGRRNSLDAGAPLPDGSIVFAQSDFVDPFHYRNDLWIEQNGEQRRLTRGARLSHPDVSPAGEIVAVQSLPATTIPVLVSSDGKKITRLVTPSPDVQWAEPRWSPLGSLIAAIRISGGLSQLVLLDSRPGQPMQVLVSDSAILSSPSWLRDGKSVAYVSTRSGVAQAYTVLAGSDIGYAPLTSATTGFFSPEFSPNSRLMAGLDFQFDGYHLGVAPAQPPRAGSRGPTVRPRSTCANCRLAASVAPPISADEVPRAKRYSPWRSLLPAYWEPVIEGSSGSSVALGVATSGADIVGRHGYYAQALFDADDGDAEAFASYVYGGLGQPFVNVSASQELEHFSIVNAEEARVGDLTRRARIVGLSASFERPRARTFASFAIGGDVESRHYSSDPDTLLAKLPAVFSRTTRYPSLFTSAAWVNAKRPGLSISREDGVSLSATVRQRWESGEFAGASRSAVGVAAAYRSLDFSGFAHHVLAIRGAAGIADSRAISTFSAGGLSGGSLDVGGGVALGGSRRTFGVRGFPPSAEQGTRAFAGTVEYRAPIAAPSRGIPVIPVFLDRVSIAAFGDAGRAYCPSSAEVVCVRDLGGPWLGSVGAEVDLDTAVQYDMATRFRFGFAVPVAGRDHANTRAVSVYVTVGSSF